jgi:ParB family chromosome partitioning protein
MGASNPQGDSIDRDYNAMFGLGRDCDAEKVVELDLDIIKPHPLDPFKPYSEERLKELADSIASVGLLDPINVRPCDDGSYEILTGKNRANAVRLNGGRNIKAIIRDVDDDTAVIMVTDSNLKHREKLLPSEKAWAYKMQLDAIKKQGKRDVSADNRTSAPLAQKLSRDIVVANNGVGKDEAQRYIRLTNLVPEFLALLDEDKIPLRAGVNLSYINKQAQNEVYRYFFILNSEKRIDLKISELIKRTNNEGKPITVDTLDRLLQKRRASAKPKSFSISRNKFKVFADRIPDDKELEKLFMEFLEERFTC